MNWANRITLVRIILLPIILVLLLIYPFGELLYHGWTDTIVAKSEHVTYTLPISYLIAGVLFAIASLSDALDGYIARKYGQVTTFGKFFDSIADKVLTNGVVIVFACANIIPVWMCLILILRDFLIDVVRQILAAKTVVMAANWLGKIRAACEMLGIFILFFVGYRMFNGQPQTTGEFNEYGWVNQIIMIPMYLATLLSITSAVNYIYLNRTALFDMAVINKPKLTTMKGETSPNEKK
ncbi:CDP-diacylglycerol--glycerol-3-phosphate 3-phosphatidyltransferase [Spiroplasma sp. DGKH1]|uniref:CDP-diacylglycerol--glycerol-3-phosphate 3-phosphatidyltransferase n=1 Tax=Spiroplasma sp. DGKH1 TaxID=3050074 RepID=UPI0034C5F6E2